LSFLNTNGLKFMATVKFAGNDQNFGYFANGATSTSNFKTVFQTVGNGYYGSGMSVTFTGAGNATQLGPNDFLLTTGNTGSPFQLGLNSPTGSGTYYSSNNSSTATISGLTDTPNDHMVTFKLFTDAAGTNWTGKYVVAWEDVPYSGSDRDFNDLVLQFQAVPEPSTLAIAGLGALGLIGYGLRRRRGA